MNAIALITDHETDYRDAMQRAAVAYLFRREGLHLSGDNQVLESCRVYLAQSLEVPAQLVQRIAELAVAEFESKTTKRLQMIGVSPRAGSTALSSSCWTPSPSTATRCRHATCRAACFNTAKSDVTPNNPFPVPRSAWVRETAFHWWQI